MNSVVSKSESLLTIYIIYGEGSLGTSSHLGVFSELVEMIYGAVIT